MRRIIFFCTIMAASVTFAQAADEPGEIKPPPGPADAAALDLKAIQGRWEREFTNPQGVMFRAENVMEGNKSTVTEFDANGNVIHSHGADFTLTCDGLVRVFTFSNLIVTAGARTGLRQPGPRSFLYRLEKDVMFEVWGLIDGTPGPFRVLVWQRPKN